MAKIRKVAPANPLSAQRQVGADAGHGFRLLAGAMEAAYDIVEPAAKAELKRRGTEAGQKAADGQMGTGFAGDFTGDGSDFDFTPYAVGGAAARSNSFTNLNPAFRGRVAEMLKAADAELGPGALKITSAYRSNEIQAALFAEAVKKYGSEEAARKWVAPPGRSRHNSGTAVDFGAAGGGLLRDPNSREAQWIKANASRFGLSVPMDWEPWQVELDGSRGPTMSTKDATIIKTPEGKTEIKLYNPVSGGLLEVYNNAAQVAYTSEVINKAAFDLTDLMNQHLLDPSGYEQAATSYIDQIIDTAPEQFAPDIRAALEDEARKGMLGLVEAKHRDIRQRADNESRALVDRWSGDYAEALASGNEEEIEAARVQLASLLSARETLPGVAWTPAQSENVILRAEDAAAKIVADRQKEIRKEADKQAALVIETAKDGRSSAYEDFIASDEYMAMNPETAREARAFLRLRDNLPSFYSAPPDQRREAVALITEQDIAEGWQNDLANAIEDADDYITEEWDKRPIETARKYMENKPPELPPLDPEGTDEFIAALAARRKYVDDLVASGRIEAPTYLDQNEADMLSAAVAADVPPEMRAALASTIISGFGPASDKVFNQIGQSDPVFKFAGKMIARGGNPATAIEALRGQELIKGNAVQKFSKPNTVTALGAFAEAFSGIPGAERAQGELIEFAQAIYAARAQGVDPSSDEAKTLFEGALNTALGQTNDGNKVRGGVQGIYNRQTYLPVGVSGEEVETALSRAFVNAFQPDLTVKGLSGAALAGFQPDPEMWAKVGPGVPMVAGEPVPASAFLNGNIRLIPVPGGNGMMYRMDYMGGGTSRPVADDQGRAYIFDIGKLAKEGKRKATAITAPRALTPEEAEETRTNEQNFQQMQDVLSNFGSQWPAGKQ